MELYENTIEKKEIFNGRIIDVSIHTVELPNGKTSTREIVTHPGAVAILAFNDENKVLMVKQFRKPFDEVLLEIPAGKLEVNEDIKGCAQRELEEETGFIGGNIEYLGKIYSSPGFCNEVIHLFKATNLIKGNIGGDEDEFIENEAYSLEEIKEMIKKGTIKDGKTVASLMYL